MNQERLDYFDEVLIQRVNVMVFLAGEYPKSIGYRRDAGLALLLLRGDRPGQVWLKLIRRYCKIGRTKAYSLMELAAGRSLEALRRVERDRKRKLRENKWLKPKAPRLKGSKRRKSSGT